MVGMPRTPPEPPDLTRLSRACAEDRHHQCGRQVLLAKPDKDGHMYTVCTCPVCKHVPDYRKHDHT